MSSFKRIELLGLDSWELKLIHKVESPVFWSPQFTVTSIMEFASTNLANGYSIEPIRCVAPQELNPADSSICFTAKWETQRYFDWSTGEIAAGDLLVSHAGAVYVDELLQDVVISNRFLLLRPKNSELGYKLWAILNSTSGKSALNDFFQTHDELDSRVFLREFNIPVFNLTSEQLLKVKSLMGGVVHSNLNDTEIAQSWISEVDLKTSEDWFKSLSSRVEIHEGNSTLLEKLVMRVSTGRAVPKGRQTNSELLPVITQRYVVTGRASDIKFAELVNESIPVALPGDVIIAGGSKRTHVYINETKSILDMGVTALTPREPISAAELARVLRLAEVRDQLNYFLSIGIIPRLRKEDVLSIHVPLDWQYQIADRVGITVLRMDLDAILWN